MEGKQTNKTCDGACAREVSASAAATVRKDQSTPMPFSSRLSVGRICCGCTFAIVLGGLTMMLGVVCGWVVGAVLRFAWSTTQYVVLGQVVSLVPATDSWRLHAGRLAGALGMTLGLLFGYFAGYRDVYDSCCGVLLGSQPSLRLVTKSRGYQLDWPCQTAHCSTAKQNQQIGIFVSYVHALQGIQL